MATLCPSGGGGSQLLVGSSPRHCGPGSCHPARDILLTHPGPWGQLSETRLVIWGTVWTVIVRECVFKKNIVVCKTLIGRRLGEQLTGGEPKLSLRLSSTPCISSQPDWSEPARGTKQLNFGLPGFKTWEPRRFGWGSTSQLGTSCRWGAPRKMCWQLLHPWYILFFLNQVGFGDFFGCETQLSAGELLVAGRQPPLEWNSRRPEERDPNWGFLWHRLLLLQNCAMVSQFNHKRPFREKSCKRPACERSWLAAVQGSDHLSDSPAFTTTTPVLPGWSAVREREIQFVWKQAKLFSLFPPALYLAFWMVAHSDLKSDSPEGATRKTKWQFARPKQWSFNSPYDTSSV